MGIPALAVSQRTALYDWSRLRNYEAPAAIQQLATDTTMNESARQLFYVQHPQLNDRSNFRNNCDEFGEQTIVLGCYVPQTGIFIFDVDDPRLQGVEQVTAAHEVLHAAYERLSASERVRVDKLTQDTYATITDARIKETVEGYRKRDPTVVANEMHSILGTEVKSLPKELEDYYAKYFTNRAQIAIYAEKYEGALTERRQKAETIQLELEGLKTEIEQLQNTLSAQQKDLDHDRPTVKTQAEANAFNVRVASYNASIRELNSMINHFNALVDEYKTISVEAQELYKALDSRPTL